jgi:hypothetical protein
MQELSTLRKLHVWNAHLPSTFRTTFRERASRERIGLLDTFPAGPGDDFPKPFLQILFQGYTS